MVVQLSTIALIDINKLKTTLMAAFFKNVLLKCLHITINLQKNQVLFINWIHGIKY